MVLMIRITHSTRMNNPPSTNAPRGSHSKISWRNERNVLMTLLYGKLETLTANCRSTHGGAVLCLK